jgi:hypothetical protein
LTAPTCARARRGRVEQAQHLDLVRNRHAEAAHVAHAADRVDHQRQVRGRHVQRRHRDVVAFGVEALVEPVRADHVRHRVGEHQQDAGTAGDLHRASFSAFSALRTASAMPVAVRPWRSNR